jgi:indolepyruvate ferredoxin oxidoreductase
MFMLGFAYQHGGLPVSADAIEKAIALNGQAIDMNVGAFRWGRRAAHDPASVQAMLAQDATAKPAIAQTLDDIIEKRRAFLVNYQNAAYAARYMERVARIRELEQRVAPGSEILSRAVAVNLFKLMAVKDEYEVARLYTDGSFRRQLAAEFQSFERLEFHMAPPILGKKGADGLPRKSTFGPWMMKGFAVLAGLRFLRRTPFDVFGMTAERRLERELLAQYEADLDDIAVKLAPGRVDAAAALASVPAIIRGYGHVKEASVKRAEGERQRLRERLDAPREDMLQAAE